MIDTSNMNIRKTKLPNNIKEIFDKIISNEFHFIGEKKIENGYLIKKTKFKGSLCYDDGSCLYATKFVIKKGGWIHIGSPLIIKINDSVEI